MLLTKNVNTVDEIYETEVHFNDVELVTCHKFPLKCLRAPNCHVMNEKYEHSKWNS